MYVSKDGQRLYLNNWNYNSARILTKLAEIVKEKGGRVEPTTFAIISNRRIDEAKRECSERLETLIEAEKQFPNENPSRTSAIKYNQDELKELDRFDNTPIKVTHTTYISFVFDNYHYYYQTDENPFFDFYYSKTLIKNNKYSADAIFIVIKKEWLFDCFFSYKCTDKDIEQAAQSIFDMLMKARPSYILRNSKKQRVDNLYDGGYHYETIYEPERFNKIDF